MTPEPPPVPADPTRTMEVGKGEPGAMIGPYRLLRQLGEGGMGVVYHAQQLEPIRRDVALKIIKPGMDSRQVIARFESERQALALMDHPNIARVLDAGATATGLPYFVMELVNGVPITRYCDSKRLTVRERIELFIPVCKAIQHAHQKGIIHRDIKPSNVLVMDLDGNAVPKVIDFGLAKALGQQLHDATMMTNLGTVVGTFEYMSPEQAELSRQDIDTRSDIYSLGVVLYELLTGATPLEHEQLMKAAYLEVLQRIREEDPVAPSARARSSASSVEIASKRRCDPSQLPKLLHGELDWIAMKALEKDRTRRYETANGFLRDIERYLSGEPVEAGPPSATYRLRKAARKHRVALGMSAALAAILAGATIYSAREAARARQAELVAEAVSNFLQRDVLAQASTAAQGGPGTKLDPDIKVRTALDRAAAKVGSNFRDQPAVEAEVRNTIAKAYADLGLYRESREQSLQAIERNKLVKGPADHATMLARYQISVDDYGLGQYKEGEETARALLETERRSLPASDALTMNTLDILASHLGAQGKFAEAEQALKEGIALAKRSGREADDTIHVELTLGTVYRDWGKFQEADKVDSDVLQRSRQMLGPDHPTALAALGALAEDYRLEGKYADAARVAQETVDAKKRALGPEHPETMVAMNNLANAYLQLGLYSQAEQLHRQVAEFDRRTRPADDPDALTPWHNLATSIYAQGRFAEAEAIERDVFEKRIRLLGRDHWLTLITSDLLGGAIAAQGRLAEAEALHSESAQIARRKMGLRNPNTLATMNRLATVYRLEGKLDRAEALQVEVVDNMKQALGEDHPSFLTAMGNLAYTRYLLHKDQEAIDLAQASIAKFESRFPDLWTHFRAEAILGAALAEEKKYAEAEPHLLRGYQGMLDRKSRMTADTWFYPNAAAKWTAAMYGACGKPDKAAEWNRKLP